MKKNYENKIRQQNLRGRWNLRIKKDLGKLQETETKLKTKKVIIVIIVGWLHRGWVNPVCDNSEKAVSEQWWQDDMVKK